MSNYYNTNMPPNFMGGNMPVTNSGGSIPYMQNPAGPYNVYPMMHPGQPMVQHVMVPVPVPVHPQPADVQTTSAYPAYGSQKQSKRSTNAKVDDLNYYLGNETVRNYDRRSRSRSRSLDRYSDEYTSAKQSRSRNSDNKRSRRSRSRSDKDYYRSQSPEDSKHSRHSSHRHMDRTSSQRQSPSPKRYTEQTSSGYRDSHRDKDTHTIDRHSPSREFDNSNPFRKREVDNSNPFRKSEVDNSNPFRKKDVDNSNPFRKRDLEVDNSNPFRKRDVDNSNTFRERDSSYRDNDIKDRDISSRDKRKRDVRSRERPVLYTDGDIEEDKPSRDRERKKSRDRDRRSRDRFRDREIRDKRSRDRDSQVRDTGSYYRDDTRARDHDSSRYRDDDTDDRDRHSYHENRDERSSEKGSKSRHWRNEYPSTSHYEDDLERVSEQSDNYEHKERDYEHKECSNRSRQYEEELRQRWNENKRVLEDRSDNDGYDRDMYDKKRRKYSNEHYDNVNDRRRVRGASYDRYSDYDRQVPNVVEDVSDISDGEPDITIHVDNADRWSDRRRDTSPVSDDESDWRRSSDDYRRKDEFGNDLKITIENDRVKRESDRHHTSRYEDIRSHNSRPSKRDRPRLYEDGEQIGEHGTKLYEDRDDVSDYDGVRDSVREYRSEIRDDARAHGNRQDRYSRGAEESRHDTFNKVERPNRPTDHYNQRYAYPDSRKYKPDLDNISDISSTGGKRDPPLTPRDLRNNINPFLRGAKCTVNFKVPTLCLRYSTRGGCHDPKCPNWHVCKFFVKGVCNYALDCKRGHNFFIGGIYKTLCLANDDKIDFKSMNLKDVQYKIIGKLREQIRTITQSGRVETKKEENIQFDPEFDASNYDESGNFIGKENAKESQTKSDESEKDNKKENEKDDKSENEKENKKENENKNKKENDNVNKKENDNENKNEKESSKDTENDSKPSKDTSALKESDTIDFTKDEKNETKCETQKETKSTKESTEETKSTQPEKSSDNEKKEETSVVESKTDKSNVETDNVSGSLSPISVENIENWDEYERYEKVSDDGVSNVSEDEDDKDKKEELENVSSDEETDFSSTINPQNFLAKTAVPIGMNDPLVFNPSKAAPPGEKPEYQQLPGLPFIPVDRPPPCLPPSLPPRLPPPHPVMPQAPLFPAASVMGAGGRPNSYSQPGYPPVVPDLSKPPPQINYLPSPDILKEVINSLQENQKNKAAPKITIAKRKCDGDLEALSQKNPELNEVIQTPWQFPHKTIINMSAIEFVTETEAYKEEFVAELMRTLISIELPYVTMKKLMALIKEKMLINISSQADMKKILSVYPECFQVTETIDSDDEDDDPELVRRNIQIKAKLSLGFCDKHGYLPFATGKCDCNALHICRFYFLNECNQKACKFGHKLKTNHNMTVFRAHKLHRMTGKEVITFIRDVDNRHIEMVPEVCRYYNRDKGECYKGDNTDPDVMCHKLHVCLFFAKGTCYKHHCRRSHNVWDKQPSTLLQMYGLHPSVVGEEKIIQMLSDVVREMERKKAARNAPYQTNKKVVPDTIHDSVKNETKSAQSGITQDSKGLCLTETKEAKMARIKDRIQGPVKTIDMKLPLVCKFYNNELGCKKRDWGPSGYCLFIHVCQHFVSGDCKFGDKCKRSHDLLSGQAATLLQKHGLHPGVYTSVEIAELLNHPDELVEVIVPVAGQGQSSNTATTGAASVQDNVTTVTVTAETKPENKNVVNPAPTTHATSYKSYSVEDMLAQIMKQGKQPENE